MMKIEKDDKNDSGCLVTTPTASSRSFIAVSTTKFITTLRMMMVMVKGMRWNLMTARPMSTMTTRPPLSIKLRE